MKPGILPDSASWRQLYTSAILELDPLKLPARIAQAEEAVVQRARELFQCPSGTMEEEQALDDAIYALHALRTALKCGTSFQQDSATRSAA